MTARARQQNLIQTPPPGTRIDDFTIAYLISHGMNADVFAAWHHELGAPVVCKRLRPDDERDKKWRRLLRTEGAALRQLQHPGIVRFIGENQAARLPYILLEHVGGETLRDELAKHGRFETEHAVRIVQHVGSAIAFAHERGYLHRDLKPSNIVLRVGRPVLLDFGVVWKWKKIRRPPDRSGTPQYLAPEQITRRALSPATDVYGLGVLLFELLTGTRPFRSGTADRHDEDAPTSEQYPQLVETPQSLSHAARSRNKSDNDRVPRKLENIVMRCLARAARERFASVKDLQRALDAFTHTKIWPREALRRARRSFSPFD